MTSRTFTSTALPPPETIEIIRNSQLDPKYIEGWLAVPSINPPITHLGTSILHRRGSINAYDLLRPFLGNKIFDGSLRTIDILNGCGHHCDTCLADAAFPSRIFSYGSLKQLFENEWFLRMLSPDSLRFGSSGDILDHPDGVKIVEMVLSKTQVLDKNLQKKTNGKKRHVIKIFTNYRPNKEREMHELISIAKKHPKRLELIISLPFNKTDVINLKFTQFALSHPDIFGVDYKPGEDNMIFFGYGSTRFKNVGVQDVRHPRLLFTSGRVLSKDLRGNRVSDYDLVEADREMGYRHRGMVKTFFNPDALWLMIYASMFESHTGRVFTPLNSNNVTTLSQTPWHPDFSTPPNWPGGSREERSWQEAKVLFHVAEASGKRRRPVHVVHK